MIKYRKHDIIIDNSQFLKQNIIAFFISLSVIIDIF